MKKTFSKIILTFFAVLLVLSVIAISIKSKTGNPTITQLNDPDWTQAGPLELSPERSRYALLFSLVEHKSFQFSTEVARLATPDLGYFNGKYVSLFAPGTSLLMVPGYYIGKYFGAAHVGATIVIGLFAAINVLLIFLILTRLRVPSIAGFIGSLIFLVATPALTYAGVMYQHHASTCMVLLSLYLALGKRSVWNLAAIFLVFGFSALIDIPNVIVILPILLYAFFCFVTLTNTKRGIVVAADPRILLSVAAICIPVGIYFIINYYSYGNMFQLSNTVTHIQALDESGRPMTGRGADDRSASDIQNLGERKRTALNFFKSRHLLNGVYAFSISPDRGIFIFTPIMLLGFFGIAGLLRRNKNLTQALLGVICLNLLLYSMRSDPWGGWGFGSRYMIPSFAVLSILLGVALNHYRKNLIFLIVFLLLGGYSIYVNVAGAISSTANPPRVEILSLEAISNRRERFSYDRNIEYLQRGKSKSVVYQELLKPYITPWDFFRITAGSLTAVIVILTSVVYLQRKTHNEIR